jgi:chromate reductase, NAD(P)H dehydrogenase (quinone)
MTSSVPNTQGSSRRDIAVLVGSLRKESFTRKIANALPELSPPELALEIVEIGELSFYNQDLEENTPAPWVAFRDRIRRCDGVLFLTPEYNRSVPAVLKNAIDVGSRPYGASVWDGKAGGIISVSPGNIGAFGANHHLRQSFVFLNILALQQPEAYLNGVGDAFDAQGKLTSERTRGLLEKYMKAFATWVGRTQV